MRDLPISDSIKPSLQVFIPNFKTDTPSKPPAPPFLHAHYPLTHNPYPDDAFYSGAWLFEPELMPAWLSEELPPTPLSSSMERKCSQRLRKKKAPSISHTRCIGSLEEMLESGTWLFDSASTPSWLRPHLEPPSSEQIQEIQRAVNRATEDPLETGIWLFHPEEAPAWLVRQLQSLPEAHSASSKRKLKKKKN
ncbi:hypothetical protein HMI54_000385 [Coelomomyces lativittatus]|nr:hypothetical protein HMI56_000592 [Coelomomyces lativittatus]KAJ1511961.1 hypothetical protein HMI54_000385 [Coelomomyces lativittatus]KAJ1518100.1 hypothetical protein HMI55_002997 [Coelomomyces lativittatus]